MNETKIIKLYTVDRFTLRMIADELKTDHHRIKRILSRHGIKVTNKGRKRKPFTEEHRKKIGRANKDKKGCWLNKKMPKSSLYKNMRSHLKYNVSLRWLMQFEDIEKLKFLNKSITRERDKKGFETKLYEQFIEKFYSDDQFNAIYQKWLRTGKEKYLKPSLDHIQPKCRHGSLLDLNNLQFLPWFENRCKNDMPQEEWESMKANIKAYLI